jgi:phage baseplate assembly protein gpV
MSTSSLINRAIVSYSNHSTGEIKVRIPSKFEPSVVLDVSFIGRKKINGVWPVPAIGEQVVVTTDNSDYTNVFIINPNPPPTNTPTDGYGSILSVQVFS